MILITNRCVLTSPAGAKRETFIGLFSCKNAPLRFRTVILLFWGIKQRTFQWPCSDASRCFTEVRHASSSDCSHSVLVLFTGLHCTVLVFRRLTMTNRLHSLAKNSPPCYTNMSNNNSNILGQITITCDESKPSKLRNDIFSHNYSAFLMKRLWLIYRNYCSKREQIRD